MNLLKSLIIISSITIFSRVLGFIRDSIIANIFGANIASDAFFIAFRIPNLLRRIFAEGAFSQAFIPILTEYKSQHGDTAARILISHIAGLLTVILIFITMIGILTAPWIIMITAPGIVNTSKEFILTTILLRIIFPYILFISLASMIGAILNTWNKFSVPAFTPVLLNISIISFSLLTSSQPNPSIIVIAWAVVFGGILQLSYQLLHLKKIDMLVLPKIHFLNVGVSRFLYKIWPAILSVSVSQISLIFNGIFTSFLVSGSVSWIYYADRLMEFPSGVLGVALGTILLPSLSRNCNNSNYEEYSRLLDWGLRLCFILATPSALALGILAHPLTVALFQYGKFSAFDTLMTQKALIAYSLGLIGLVLIKVLISGFYSLKDVKTPGYIAILTLIITQLMNLTFISQLKHVGLSLSISLAACFNAALLYWQLRRKKLFVPQPGWIKFFFRLLLSVTAMYATLAKLLMFIPDWAQGSISLRLLRLFIVITLGIITYFTSLWLVGFRIQNFIYILHKN